MRRQFIHLEPYHVSRPLGKLRVPQVSPSLMMGQAVPDLCKKAALSAANLRILTGKPVR